MNRAEEDYIKVIYELTAERNQELAKNNEIALQLGFSDQTVNEMIKKLSISKYVEFYPYKGVKLTKKGEKEAIRMVRAHRIWEVFLTEKLGFSWADVHENAERLEHASSQTMIDKLYHFLGSPKYCQHGNPIPNENGKWEDTYSHIALLNAENNDRVQLIRVIDNKDLLTYLDTLGIALYDTFTIVSKDDFGQIMQLESNQKRYVLSFKIADMMYINYV